MVDDDVMAAIVTKWVADVGAGHLQVLIAGGPKAGKIPSPTPIPYCHVDAKEAAATEWASGGVGWFSRKVTLCVYAKKADAVTIGDRIDAVFANATNTGAKTLTVPNSSHLWTRAPQPGKLEPDPARKDGEEVWKNTIEYVVELSRASP